MSIAKLDNAAVTAPKIASNAVDSSKINAAAVTGDKIAALAVSLSGAELRQYSETSTTPAISSGSLTLDLKTGNVFEIVLTEDVTSLILASAPEVDRAGAATLILRQDATGGRTFSWPGVKWPGGSPPAVTAGANAIDIYAIVTRDGGATWYGFPGGQDFS